MRREKALKALKQCRSPWRPPCFRQAWKPAPEAVARSRKRVLASLPALFQHSAHTLTDRVTRHPQTRSQAALAWMPALLPPVALSCSALRSRCLGTKSCSGTSLGPTDAGVPSRGHRVEGGATDGSVSTLPRLSVRDTRGSRIGRC